MESPNLLHHPDGTTHPTTLPQPKTPMPSLDAQLHLEIAPTVHAAAPLQGHAGFPVEEEPVVALAALEARPAARGRHGEAGAGEVAGAGAELVVAVGWAGEGWEKKEKREKNCEHGPKKNHDRFFRTQWGILLADPWYRASLEAPKVR